MASKRVVAGLVIIGALAAAPTFAEQGQRRRSDADRQGGRSEERARSVDDRAVPRSRTVDAQRQEERRQEEIRRQDAERRQEIQRQDVRRQQDAQRRLEVQRRDNQRQYEQQRQREAVRQYDSRRGYDIGRDVGRRPSYSDRIYGRVIVRPRVIRPTIVTVVPYRPYVYRPSYSVGVYYGSGGHYPYGYTPRGYYDPIPGRIYGGLRITGAPRSAYVFADGYYVGIVNDFDGIFQHLNLEAGPHRIEIEEPGFEPIEFDVMVQPGRTITFRADMYRY